MESARTSTVLAISSQVAAGHVGLSAIVPALHCLGHEVIALPTVLLSAHPGHGPPAVCPIDPQHLAAIAAAQLAEGWLDGVTAVLTGYLPTAGHVRFAAETIRGLRQEQPGLLVVCDPVLGDDPKGLYIDAAAAAAIRDELVPLASLITPNRFEWEWLGRPIACKVIVTSARADALGVSSILMAEGRTWHAMVPQRAPAPHGAGDLLAALATGHLAAGRSMLEAFARSVAGVDAVLAGSVGRRELALVAGIGRAADAAPAALEELPASS